MKNITKILLALMLCLGVVFATVACNGGDAEKEATETLENFLDAFVELDLDKAQDYVLDADGEWDGVDAGYFVSEMMSGMPAEFEDYEDDIEKFYKDELFDNISYKIKKTDVKSDDKVVFEVEFTAPEMEDFDMEDLMEEKTMELFEELYNDGKIHEGMSEEEIYDVFVPELMDLMIDIIKDEISTTTETEDFTVVKKDGKQYVEPEGDMEELLDFDF